MCGRCKQAEKTGVLETMDKALVEEGLSLLWAIWNWRNKEVMNGEKVMAQFVFEKGVSFLYEFRRAQVSRPLHGPYALVVWKAPVRDFYKINFDGAFSKAEAIGGIGVMAKDVDGLVTGALHLAVWNMGDAASVEATATAIAAKFVKDLGLSKVIIEGDALAIINAINSTTPDLSTIGNIIEEIRVIGRSFQLCQLCMLDAKLMWQPTR
ncbi:hypothetical protein PTKIN_Ptkin06aG0122300 [Pterospermum kingtungense]